MRAFLVVLLVLAVACVRVSEDASGEEIYDALCSRCHGTDLEGGSRGPALGAGSESEDRSDVFSIETVTRGRGSRMPGFGSSLSEAQIERVVKFIRAEQGK